MDLKIIFPVSSRLAMRRWPSRRCTLYLWTINFKKMSVAIPQDGGVIRKLDDKSTWVTMCTVICVQREQNGWRDAALRYPRVDYFMFRQYVVHTDLLGSVGQEWVIPTDASCIKTKKIHLIWKGITYFMVFVTFNTKDTNKNPLRENHFRPVTRMTLEA